MMRLAHKLQEEGELSVKENKLLWSAIHPYMRLFITERIILGLPTKPARLTSLDEIESYQIEMGYKEPPANTFYNSVKETIMDIDKLLEYKRRLQGYIDEVDKRGAY